jgi:hypothetical protein
MTKRRVWPRLTDPADSVTHVRQTGGNRTVWMRMGAGNPYWSTRGWENGVDWAQVLRWGEVEDVSEEYRQNPTP